jgi:hypothetical protein
MNYVQTFLNESQGALTAIQSIFPKDERLLGKFFSGSFEDIWSKLLDLEKNEIFSRNLDHMIDMVVQEELPKIKSQTAQNITNEYLQGKFSFPEYIRKLGDKKYGDIGTRDTILKLVRSEVRPMISDYISGKAKTSIESGMKKIKHPVETVEDILQKYPKVKNALTKTGKTARKAGKYGAITALGTATVAGLGYGGKKLYDKYKDHAKEHSTVSESIFSQFDE